MLTLIIQWRRRRRRGREGSPKCVISVRGVTKTELCVVPNVKIKDFAFLASLDGKNLEADPGFKLEPLILVFGGNRIFEYHSVRVFDEILG